MARTKRPTVYFWKESDEEFAAAMATAAEQAADRLEQEARRRAVEGLRRVKFGKGGEPLIDPETLKPYTELEFSDTLLIFLLKGIRPEKYRERVSQEIGGPGGGPVEVVFRRPVNEAD